MGNNVNIINDINDINDTNNIIVSEYEEIVETLIDYCHDKEVKDCYKVVLETGENTIFMYLPTFGNEYEDEFSLLIEFQAIQILNEDVLKDLYKKLHKYSKFNEDINSYECSKADFEECLKEILSDYYK